MINFETKIINGEKNYEKKIYKRSVKTISPTRLRPMSHVSLQTAKSVRKKKVNFNLIDFGDLKKK
jgi:hypothetical protein